MPPNFDGGWWWLAKRIKTKKIILTITNLLKIGGLFFCESFMNSLITSHNIHTTQELRAPVNPVVSNIELTENPISLPVSILVPVDFGHPEKGWERIEIK